MCEFVAVTFLTLTFTMHCLSIKKTNQSNSSVSMDSMDAFLGFKVKMRALYSVLMENGMKERDKAS